MSEFCIEFITKFHSFGLSSEDCTWMRLSAVKVMMSEVKICRSLRRIQDTCGKKTFIFILPFDFMPLASQHDVKGIITSMKSTFFFYLLYVVNEFVALENNENKVLLI